MFTVKSYLTDVANLQIKVIIVSPSQQQWNPFKSAPIFVICIWASSYRWQWFDWWSGPAPHRTLQGGANGPAHTNRSVWRNERKQIHPNKNWEVNIDSGASPDQNHQLRDYFWGYAAEELHLDCLEARRWQVYPLTAATNTEQVPGPPRADL